MEEGLWEVKMKVRGGGLGGGELRDVRYKQRRDCSWRDWRGEMEEDASGGEENVSGGK